jgi:hypothetical protein
MPQGQRGAEVQLHSLNLGARLRCLVNITLQLGEPRCPLKWRQGRGGAHSQYGYGCVQR